MFYLNNEGFQLGKKYIVDITVDSNFYCFLFTKILGKWLKNTSL